MKQAGTQQAGRLEPALVSGSLANHYRVLSPVVKNLGFILTVIGSHQKKTWSNLHFKRIILDAAWELCVRELG